MKTVKSLAKTILQNRHIVFGYMDGHIVSSYIVNPIKVNCMTNVYMPYIKLIDNLVDFTTMFLNRSFK